MTNLKKIFGLLFVTLATLVAIQGLSSCSSKEDRFDKAITQLNKMLPMNLGNGLTMQKVTSENDAVIYEIKCNEREIDMALLEQNQAELKANTLAQLKQEKSSSKDFQSLLEFCQEKDKKIIYRYVGFPSRKTVDIVIDSNEI